MRDRAAILLVRDGRLLLMRRRKGGEEYHALPGGKIEDGETPEQAAVREALEETSLEVTLGEKLLTFKNQGRREYYFRATAPRGEATLGGPELARQSATNYYALEWVDADQLAALDLRPALIREACAASLAGEGGPTA